MKLPWILAGALLVALTAQVATSLDDEPAATAAGSYHRVFFEQQVGLTATGASSCASTNCHGGAQPRPGERFLGDEWDRWWDRGKGAHFRAYKVLEEKRSVRMAQLLYGPKASARTQAECLACHTLAVPEKLRGRSFDAAGEGVSCEACHGRSEKWMGPHQNQRIWRGEMGVDERTALGFYDTVDPARRAELCLSCHLGTSERVVTHKMMAAGHPALTFEFVSDLNDVPKHWNDELAYLTPEEGKAFYARLWTVGQLVAFRESMNRLIQWAEAGDVTDYAVFECYACHHDIGTQLWRQSRTFHRPPGDPAWDAAGWAMVRPILRTIAPDRAEAFARRVDRLQSVVSMFAADRQSLMTEAAQLRDMSDSLARSTNGRAFDAPLVRALLGHVLSDARDISLLGYRAAVQAYLAVEALYIDASSPSEAALQKIRELHDLLYKEGRVEDPGSYDPVKFAEGLSALAALLGK